MKRILFFLSLVCIGKAMQAQYIYTIKADSVKITNTCDTAELIIENHTQNVCGFLFNKGRGRTEFRRGLIRINDSISLIGCDTLKMNPWLQGGNRFGTTGILGTMDNNHVDFYTNSLQRARLTNNGVLQIGNILPDNGDKLQVSNKGGVTVSANLSRSSDRIQIGRYLNSEDGQNALIRTSNDNGATYKNILVERDGYIGLGTSNKPGGWNVGNPALRLYPNGVVNVASNYFMFGYPYGNFNSSALMTYVSNLNEWDYGGNYPNRQNFYYFGTQLGGADGENVRANLKISGRELNFLTGATEGEAMKIAENRNVIIGSQTDDGSKLQVKGVVSLTNSEMADIKSPRFQVLVGDESVNGGTGFLFYGDHTSRPIQIGTGHSNNFRKFYFQTAGQPGDTIACFNFTYNGNVTNGLNFYNYADGSTKLLLTGPGNLVLGSTSDNGNKLQVTGNANVTGNVTVSGSAIRFAGLSGDNSVNRILAADVNGNLYYRDASSLALNETMNSDLAVNGRISAQKMLITQTGRWPDYVFSKHYKLPSLSEVENFISQNNHLPGIPSAAEVEKKGIDVGCNQAAQLRKIEELTLYIIQQDKELKSLKQEIEDLKVLIKGK
jgi:hypothetical protein